MTKAKKIKRRTVMKKEIEGALIKSILKDIGKNETWLAAEMEVHFNTIVNKIKRGEWTKSEVALLVNLLGDELIEKAKLDDRCING